MALANPPQAGVHPVVGLLLASFMDDPATEEPELDWDDPVPVQLKKNQKFETSVLVTE